MAIRADITNFRILRDVHLHDDGALSLIVGYNESGKSSLCGAFEYGMTKSAFGHRGKETARLITHGEERMHIRINVGNLSVNQTQSTGDTLTSIANQLAVPTDVLPVLFNSKMCGDGGNKSLKTFLDGNAASKFDPVLHFQNDPDVSAALALAKRAGKSTTKQFIAFFEDMRASSKEPAVPIMPSLTRPTAVELAKSQEALAPVMTNVTTATTTVNDLKNTFNQLNRIKQFVENLAQYEIAAKAHDGSDALAPARAKNTRIAAINPATLTSIAAVLYDEELGTTIEALVPKLYTRINEAKAFIANNPPPKPPPVQPVLASDLQALYTELGASATVETLNAFLVDANAGISNATKELDDANKEYARLSQIRDSLLLREGQWVAYDNAVPQYEIGKAKANADWQRWDNAAKAVAAAETEHLNKAGDSFGKMVSQFSEYLLQGRTVSINRDTGISLGGINIQDCTESTKWRIEVCIMAAIAKSLGSPLLVIDAADILDEQNKQFLLDFLMKQIVPFFSHVIVTATCRGKLEDEYAVNVEGVTKWTLRAGILAKAPPKPK